MQKQTSQWLIPIILAVGAAVALWYYWVRVSAPEEPPVMPVQPAEEPAPVPQGPAHPVEPAAPVETEAADLVPLPPLDRSDEYFKIEIANVFGDPIETMLAESGLIERVVATIDNLPRSHVAENVRPVDRLAGPFLVDGQDESGEFTINPANYERYDEIVALVTSANMTDVASLYRRYYPLFQKAYVNLGYPQGYFNDRLVEVIDHLLDTPELTGPVQLVRPNVLYHYEDPAIEGLSSGQKLMLRLGPDHSAKMKASLREIRKLVTTM